MRVNNNINIFQDKEGNVTCSVGKGASVVDYVNASSDLLTFVTDFKIIDIDDSDHFPGKCTLEFPSEKAVTTKRLLDSTPNTKGELLHSLNKFVLEQNL